jgi:hypothetical protein
MKRSAALLMVFLLALLCAMACSRSAPTEYRPTSTIKEIMDSIVDPNADGIWDSMEVVATLEGTVEKMPTTDDDWKALRRHAVAVVEAANLLVMPGRHVAQPGQKAEDAHIDLGPEEIEALINQDRANWARLAFGLQDAGTQNVKAIDARDLKQLLEAGETLDTACENCHRKYWYRVDPGVVPSQRDK